MGKEQLKYVSHNQTGLPIRIPPYLRRELRRGEPIANVQLAMIQQDPYVGERCEQDTLPSNMAENIRLRRVARRVSRELVSLAEQWWVERYCTIVHGSLAKGLIRHPSSPDKSDVDIDLIIDDPTVPSSVRKQVREEMHKASNLYGARVDAYIWNMDEVKRNVGEYARYFLRAAPYSIANKGGAWEEVRWIGIESQRYVSLEPRVKKRVRIVLSLMAQGEIEEAMKCVTPPDSHVRKLMRAYLTEEGLLEENERSIQEKAGKLNCLVSGQIW